jgi:hypothetical protein
MAGGANMGIWEWLTVFGFTAAILGVFLTIYGMINNKTLKEESRLTREILLRIEEGLPDTFASRGPFV